MRISKLISGQGIWEGIRGIVNPSDGIPRIQAELDEAKEATIDSDRIEELIDVLIITAGGLARVLERNGLKAEDAENLLEAKLRTNDAKYPLGLFEGRSTEEAINAARHYWALGIDPDRIEGNDTY